MFMIEPSLPQLFICDLVLCYDDSYEYSNCSTQKAFHMSLPVRSEIAIPPSHSARSGNLAILAAGLWLLWAVLLSAGLIVDRLSFVNASGYSAIGRLGSSLVLVAAGWCWFANFRLTSLAAYAGLVALGMSLGALGDFFNAGLLQSLIPLPNPVLGGIAAFGLGHLAYIRGCFDARRRAGLRLGSRWWAAVLAWQLVAAVSWYWIVLSTANESLRVLVWPALAYSLLLAGTAGVATGLAVQDRRFAILAVGSALFLISDLVLAWGMFRGSFPFRTQAVWIPYSGGQMLIVYAIFFFRSALSSARQSLS